MLLAFNIWAELTGQKEIRGKVLFSESYSMVKVPHITNVLHLESGKGFYILSTIHVKYIYEYWPDTTLPLTKDGIMNTELLPSM